MTLPSFPVLQVRLTLCGLPGQDGSVAFEESKLGPALKYYLANLAANEVFGLGWGPQSLALANTAISNEVSRLVAERLAAFAAGAWDLL